MPLYPQGPTRPTDASVIEFRDDFIGGADPASLTVGAVSTGIGNMNWTLKSITGTTTSAYVASVVPNYGSFQTTTGASSGDLCSFYLGPSGTPFVSLDQPGWEAKWVFKISATTNIRFRVGFSLSAPNTIEPARGIWLRYDTNASFADAAFKYVCRSASTTTVSGTTATVDTNYHSIRMRVDVAGTVIFNFDTGADVSVSTNVPTGALSPGFILGNDAAATKACEVDFFGFAMRGVARS